MFDKCDECGYDFFRNNLHKFGDKKICVLCIPNEYTICCDCGEVIEIQNVLHGRCRTCNINLSAFILRHYLEPKNFNISKLSTCLDYTEINSILDEIGIDKEISKRIEFLYCYMGITQSFSCPTDNKEVTLEEEYIFAKQQLILMNERNIVNE